MIYLDVTSSCKSAKNTGIQRMTRKIFAELGQREAILPICWNLSGENYQRLGRREIKILERPFHSLPQATARPDWRGEHVIAELHRRWFRKGIRLEHELGQGDILFVPDIYRDGRTDTLPKLIAQTEVVSIAIFHDAATLRLPSLSERERGRIYRYIDSLTAFDLVICVSQESQDDLQRLWAERGNKPTQTSVEAWPIEFEASERNGNQLVPNRILSVGSLEQRKNHLTLLHAAEILWNEGLPFELELIGRSNCHYAHEIKSEIRRLKRKGRTIRWLRHVNDQRLHRAYRECQFTIYPSLAEGFGLPIFESLWHGKPCICGSNGALGEAGQGGGCFFVDQTDPESLAQGSRVLLTDRSKYERLCSEARNRAFHTWNDYIDRFIEHLRQLEPALAL